MLSLSKHRNLPLFLWFLNVEQDLFPNPSCSVWGRDLTPFYPGPFFFSLLSAVRLRGWVSLAIALHTSRVSGLFARLVRRWGSRRTGKTRENTHPVGVRPVDSVLAVRLVPAMAMVKRPMRAASSTGRRPRPWRAVLTPCRMSDVNCACWVRACSRPRRWDNAGGYHLV